MEGLIDHIDVDANGVKQTPILPYIKLADLLWEHIKYRHKIALSDSLGDGYLCFSNPIFRGVRIQILKLGYRFSCEDVGEYFSAPILYLDEILRKKIIPYGKTYSSLRRLGVKLDTLSNPIIALNLISPNYTIHESCHALGYEAALVNPLSTETLSQRQKFVLDSLVAEAFASASESMAAGFILTETDWALMSRNSYRPARPSKSKLLNRVLNLYGYERIYLYLIVYILYDLFFKKPKANEIEQILQFAGFNNELTLDERSHLETIIKNNTRLSDRFKQYTNLIYFTSHGFTENLEEILNIPFQSHLKPGGDLQIRLKSLISQVLTAGNERLSEI